MKAINRLEKKSEKYWILFYYDHDKKTFNPGVEISKWGTVQEIERITVELQNQGRNVRISTTQTVFSRDDLRSQSDCIKAGPLGYKYDPFLIW